MKLTKHISYTGVQEPNRRIFDLTVSTPFGTGYNSYVVTGDKTAVIDTVPEEFAEEYLEKLKAVLPADRIDYVILNHASPDHVGSLSALLNEYPDLVIYATAEGMKYAGAILNRSLSVQVVQEEELLDLGQDVILRFLTAPGLPWPDTMFTCLENEGVLFSGDVFSTHLCEPAVRDQYIKDIGVFREERYRYFAEVFGGAKGAVRAALRKLDGLSLYMICPGHGPVLEHYLKETLGYYYAWSMEIPAEDYVAIFYMSAYGYTEKMARQMANELRREAIPVRIFNVSKKEHELMEKVINEASGLLIGSPTVHKDAPKPIWDLISCLKAINLDSKPALVFGSYGWSGEAGKNISDRLRALNFRVLGDGVTCVLKPSAEDKRRIGEAAKEFAAAMKQ